MNHTHRRIIRFAAFAAIAGAAVAGPALAATDALAPLRQRTTDAIVARDLGHIEALTSQLAATRADDTWRIERAKALLEAAGREYQENDRTGFDAAAYAEARAMVEQVASGAAAVTNASVPAGIALPGTARVREDLWTSLETLKKGDGFACARAELARAEVQLQWAGNEQLDQGECRVSPHVAEAERLLREAATLAAGCAPAPVAVVKPAPTPIPPTPITPSEPVAPVAPAPTPEELRIPRNVHFALDRYVLSERSREVIAGVVAVMKKYPSISVRLEGHTDSRASVAYNLRLSKNRVNAVATHMRALGIEADRVTTAFKGEGELKTTEDSNANFARNRRVEMVFVDSEGHDIHAEDQEEDLQLEGSSPAPKKAAPARRSTRRR